MLRTQIFEKAIFPVKKSFWPIFFRNIGLHNCQVRNYKGLEGISSAIVQLLRSFLLITKRSLETNISNKSCFHSDKSFWSIFHRIIECDKPRITKKNGLRSFLKFFVDVKRSFFQDLSGCWEHKFLKKSKSFQWREDFDLIFIVFRIVELDNCQLTSYKGSQGNLATIVHMMISIL